ncbi:MAG: AraC family transcriptional regulator [Victivallales bacterium]
MREQLNYNEIQAFEARVAFRRIHLHYHNMHEFFYCVDGPGEQLTVNGVEKINPGELFFFPAGDAHRGSGCLEQDCIGAVVNVGDESFSGCGSNGKEFLHILQLLKEQVRHGSYRLPLTREGGEAAGAIIRQMAREFVERQTGFNCALQALAMQLLLAIIRHGKFPSGQPGMFADNRKEGRMEFVRSYLKENSFRQIDVAEICSLLHTSRSHFHAEFLRHNGCTMLQYLNRLRCQQAIQLLQKSELPLDKITEYCGFGSLCSLYRILRHETGKPPSSYRDKGGRFLQ